MGDMDVRAWTAQPRFLLFLLVQAVVAFSCLAAIVGLRFVRRGAARFWIGPAVVALSVLPGVVAVGGTLLAYRDVISATALVGAGSSAALAAGATESLIPLLLGTFSVGGLSLCALLVVAAGSSRFDESAPAGGATWGPLLAPVMIVLGFVPMLAATGLANHGGVGALDAAGTTRWWRLLAGGTVASLLALVGLAAMTALRAPRTRASLAAKLLPPLSLVASAFAAAVFCIATFSSMARLAAHATREPEVAEPSPAATVEPVPAAAPEPEPEPPAVTEATPRPTTRPRPAATRPPRAPEAPRSVRVGGSIPEPRKLKNVAPFYPAAAKQARVQGVVILECTIGVDGRVEDVKVLRSVPLLDAAAVDAVRQWVYTPTLLNGVPVPVIMTVTVNFKLS
jgi:TonB family protein